MRVRYALPVYLKSIKRCGSCNCDSLSLTLQVPFSLHRAVLRISKLHLSSNLFLFLIHGNSFHNSITLLAAFHTQLFSMFLLHYDEQRITPPFLSETASIAQSNHYNLFLFATLPQFWLTTKSLCLKNRVNTITLSLSPCSIHHIAATFMIPKPNCPNPNVNWPSSNSHK